MYKLLDGKKIKEELLISLNKEVKELGKVVLAVILVGNDTGSKIYFESKKKLANSLSIEFMGIIFDEGITEKDLIDKICELNNDKNVNGIMIEMPLPKHIDREKVLSYIDIKKDVDGLNDKSLTNLIMNKECFIPCTVLSVITLLDYYDIDLVGKSIVILGRSRVVGLPLSFLLLNKNATITICHSKTEKLSSITSRADILIVAMNKQEFITNDYVKDNAVIVDVGIHRKKENDKTIVCGDVNFDNVKDKVSYISAVPGGVGVLTTLCIMKNCIKAKRLYG